MMGIYNDLFGVPERKKSINSKRKGNDNEYSVARFFTDWVGTDFGRVPSSGGLRWQGESRFIGDVVPKDESFEFPFTIETKSYARLFNKDKSISKIVLKFWQQCLDDCKRSGKMPLLIMREKNMAADTWYILFDPINFHNNGDDFRLEYIHGTYFYGILSSDLKKIPYLKFLSLTKKI